jgi:hypothetical protein
VAYTVCPAWTSAAAVAAPIPDEQPLIRTGSWRVMAWVMAWVVAGFLACFLGWVMVSFWLTGLLQALVGSPDPDTIH